MTNFTWNGDQFRRQIQNEIAVRLERAGAAGVATAKERVPVKTGRTRDSISAVVHRTTMMVEVRAETKWAIFIELGTRRVLARPFLRPALATAIKALGL